MKLLAALLLSIGLSADAATPSETDSNISLREYIDIRFDAQEKAVNAALAAADRAVAKAEAATEARFTSVNEFRASLNDQGRLMMPRSEAEQLFKAQNEKIDLLTTEVRAKYTENAGRLNARDSRVEGIDNAWILFVAVLAAVASAYSIYTTKRSSGGR